jgi:FkbM family methyltransferase
MPSSFNARFLIRPLVWLEVPGWGRMLSLFGAHAKADPRNWKDSPTVTIRGKRHGYRMNLRLADWSERQTYYLGRFCELGTLLLLESLLKPGERFVDVGANIGMVTLEAAKLVGVHGRVDSFEPNPLCLAVLKKHCEVNQLVQVHIHEIALADTETQMTLSVPSSEGAPLHDGEGTLANLARQNGESVLRQFHVEVRTGDAILSSCDARPPSLIKIDVEGFEERVVKGLRVILKNAKPALFTEFVESHLVRADSSRKRLFEVLSESGYVGHAVSTRRAWWRHRLHLEKISDANAAAAISELDVLWLHEQDARLSHDRIKTY